jgi:hypothetical protein
MPLPVTAAASAADDQQADTAPGTGASAVDRLLKILTQASDAAFDRARMPLTTSSLFLNCRLMSQTQWIKIFHNPGCFISLTD